MWNARRKQLFLDRVQSVLIMRVISYWLFCLLAGMLMACLWLAWSDPPASSGEMLNRVLHTYGPVFAATLIVVPLVVVDVLRLSNRFVGPAHRLRQALKQAAEGQAVRPIQFRENDFWRDAADNFNRALALREPETANSAE
jgi:hypothetical protein